MRSCGSARASHAWIAALEKELSEIDGDIDAGVRGSLPAWREKWRSSPLRPFLACGSITARTLIAELPELGTPRRQALITASLAGQLPHSPANPAEVEGAKPKMLIAGGRKSVRSALFYSLASLVACRQQPRPQGLSPTTSSTPASRAKMLVAIAAARKLLTILNAIPRDKQSHGAQENA